MWWRKERRILPLIADGSAVATYATDGASYGKVVQTEAAWTVGSRKGTDGGNGTQVQISDNDYLYLSTGGGSLVDGVYTAGKFIIKLYGVKADFS